ncbi:DMT family transporter [Tepidibacillus infernus]|uniref:EamA domain-containing protein n=1 Tax=Tepidibacillus decaturensis TaxID=1413211 RepID=A0A135L2A8_9BACI|nr:MULTISPECIES: DMT family transporter [Tepidibacillus]KXG43019.1 hypothetical protein U473_02505 [Tepidibacillus decaturensis]GBF10849.1 putative DMT superfamily transporter inner membrane protein [Tepidibacillus sp. HK-1]
MKNKRFLADSILLIVALIWGTTFVMVQNAISILLPHSFNGIRFALASLILFPIILMIDRNSFTSLGKRGWIAGTLLGVFLFGGYAFQTVGLLYTSASKAGFITGLNVVLVPIFSILLLKVLPKWPTILGSILAAVGLYLLTMVETSSIQFGDFLIFMCAIFFALQIVFTGKYAPNYPTLPLAWIQISVVAILSLIFAFLFEDFTHQVILGVILQKEVLFALFITAVFATTFAFVAQTMLQTYTTSTRVAIIFSMEPVFAALTSYLIQNERLTSFAIIGGLFIILGMILAEIPPEAFANKIRFKSKRNDLV